MKFRIFKTRKYGWTIQQGRRMIDEMCWDELIGAVARMLLCGQQLPARDDATESPDAEYFLTVESVGPSSLGIFAGLAWTIRRDDRFIDRLTDDEALGFIAAYTLTDGERQLFIGLQTYEEWVSCFRWRRDQETAGLLTYSKDVA